MMKFDSATIKTVMVSEHLVNQFLQSFYHKNKGRLIKKYGFMNNRLGDCFIESTYMTGVYNGLQKCDTTIGSPAEYLHKMGVYEILNQYNKITRHENEEFHVDSMESDNVGENRDYALYMENTTTNDEYEIGYSDRVQSALDTLTNKQRTICNMLVDGYSHKEIASHFGVSRQAIEKSITSIRKRFEKLKLNEVAQFKVGYYTSMRGQLPSMIGQSVTTL